MSEGALLRLPDRPLRLAFFGTPAIARTILERLLAEGKEDLRLVVSQPDRPKGRGQKLEPTPVKALAEARGVEVIQPAKLKDGAVAHRLSALDLDLAIVVAYGRILPRDVFLAPRVGTWNVHASLLPRHRGASPIQHAILAGDEETGVTLMELTEGLDEGPMLLARRMPLDGTETAGRLAEALAELGAQVLLEGLTRAKREGLRKEPQPAEGSSYAPLIQKSDGILDLGAPAAVLERRIRAFDPWPGGALALDRGQALRVLSASVAPGEGAPPGTVVEAGPGLVIATGDQSLRIHRLQPPGKRPMSPEEFLRGAGRHVRIGMLLSGC